MLGLGPPGYKANFMLNWSEQELKKYTENKGFFLLIHSDGVFILL